MEKEKAAAETSSASDDNQLEPTSFLTDNPDSETADRLDVLSDT